MNVAERAARLRRQPGLLGRWYVVLERVGEDFRRTEQQSATLVRRLGARLVRWSFELLVLVLIAIVELDLLRRRAGNALAAPRRR
jgi:hypothetical protein